jgi:hypothetical protein
MRSYEAGASFGMLHDAGVQLSWDAAQWVYAAGRAQLDEVHATRKAYGNLVPRAIRLGSIREPFVFAGEATGRGDPKSDRVQLARAIASIASHPEPTIDRLLRDPVGAEVLCDLLLERGRAIDPLLCELANVVLPEARLVDHATIDDELAALWNRVLELDPLMDTTRKA